MSGTAVSYLHVECAAVGRTGQTGFAAPSTGRGTGS